VTADRGGLSAVALRGPEGDPILAQWQHGLGRVTAYTSDAATRWNAAWTPWSMFDSFWGQQIKWVMRPSGDANARVTVDARGDLAKVTLDLLDAAGERVNFAAIRARLVPPATGDVGRASARDVSFRQVGPGRYEAEMDAAAVGSHLLSIRYDAGGSEENETSRRAGSMRAAIIRRAGEEFRQPSPNTTMLKDLATKTNGRFYRLDPQGVDLWVREHLTMPEISRSVWLLTALAAISVFLFDVAVRRIAIDLARVWSRVGALFGRAPAVASASMAKLGAAKARAGSTTAARSVGPAGAPHPEWTASPETQSPASDPTRSPAESGVAKGPPPAEGDVMARLRAAKERSLPPP
jgi:hypothetical protein